ncbi:hypothetical protein CAOG_06647 [Capsaspora owczarzaki ATCC 30864]|uniref:hypothetical protein n=1 Tax=Capsaspora owczarzaki (strain ATCC 30864) TaxID=595528 RepID=UPI00035250E7|nr:hypothetical protein CAOG_06647 [Capsaspora owczarzaki ATCC 30864]|eukprot:XP_004344268.2 hypothetical protein CAOG_06647 [Capsaspora owczarzaki ATCC 30864]
MLERAIHQGVEVIRVGLFPGRINTTVCMFRTGSTLIDCGPPNQWSPVKAYLTSVQTSAQGLAPGGSAVQPVKELLITHHHEDHSGNAARIKRDFPSISIRAPKTSLKLLTEGFEVQMYRRLVWGKPPTVDVHGSFDAILADSASSASVPPPAIRPTIGHDLSIVPVAAPGHCSDMTVMFDPARGHLFSGDLFVTSKPLMMRNDEDVNDEIASLRRVLSLDWNTLFCAHRGFVSDGKKLLQQRLDHFLEMRAKATELNHQGLSHRAIASKLFGKEEALYYLSRGHFSKKHLVEGLLSAPHHPVPPTE